MSTVFLTLFVAPLVADLLPFVHQRYHNKRIATGWPADGHKLAAKSATCGGVAPPVAPKNLPRARPGGSRNSVQMRFPSAGPTQTSQAHKMASRLPQDVATRLAQYGDNMRSPKRRAKRQKAQPSQAEHPSKHSSTTETEKTKQHKQRSTAQENTRQDNKMQKDNVKKMRPQPTM